MRLIWFCATRFPDAVFIQLSQSVVYFLLFTILLSGCLGFPGGPCSLLPLRAAWNARPKISSFYPKCATSSITNNMNEDAGQQISNGNLCYTVHKTVKQFGEASEKFGDSVFDISNSVSNASKTITKIGDATIEASKATTKIGEAATKIGEAASDTSKTFAKIGESASDASKTYAKISVYTQCVGCSVWFFFIASVLWPMQKYALFLSAIIGALVPFIVQVMLHLELCRNPRVDANCIFPPCHQFCERGSSTKSKTT